MNLQNLHEGQIIKNYRELFELIKEDEKEKIAGGKSKIIKLQELERYVKFKRGKGQSYIIEQIYKQEISKQEDGRKLGNKSIYVDDISVQLLNYLVEDDTEKVMVNNDERVFLTARKIFQITGMINEKYIPNKQTIEKYIWESPISLKIEDVDEFYARTESKMREMLKSALINLERRLILLVEKRHKIFDGKKNRMATNKEERRILGIKNRIMEQLLSKNVVNKNLGKIYFIGKLPEFYQRVNEEVAEQLGLHHIQYGFLIGYTDRLEENLSSYKKEYEELLKIKNSLNDKFSKFVDKDAKRRYLKMQKEHQEELDKFMAIIDREDYEKPLPPSKNWEDNQIYLTEDLIKLPPDIPPS
jgi:hypothetical protein